MYQKEYCFFVKGFDKEMIKEIKLVGGKTMEISTVDNENKIIVTEDRLCPFTIRPSQKHLVVCFNKEVTAISFFHHSRQLQSICEEAKYNSNVIEAITFDFNNTEWLDTLALCYILLFVHCTKKELRSNISFILPQKPELVAFLLDNGFVDQMRKLANNFPTIPPEISNISYSKIHRCLLPLQILKSKEEISDIVETAKNQLVSIYGMQLPSGELDSTINKLSYFLQETLDNVYTHAYSTSIGPCAVLIKQVDCKDIDVANYQKSYTSKTPYINISLFENYETYLEVYIADVGCGLRNSFLTDPTGSDAMVTDLNILEYILSSGERSHKKISSLDIGTYYGGLYDIYYQFSKDHDSLGIKGDSCWFSGARALTRLNTEIPYRSYNQLMHGFALVGAIQFQVSIPDNYELLHELDSAINSWKNKIFKEEHINVYKKNKPNVCVIDERAGLANVEKNVDLNSAKTTTVFYPKEFASKLSIVRNFVESKSVSFIIAGIQESEIKKYRSLVESLKASRGNAQKLIIVTNTMYVFEYTRKGETYVYSVGHTREYIQNRAQSISDSFLYFLIWDRVYNSACIWHLAKEAKLPVFITSDVEWNINHPIHGYLDFSQLSLIPLCRDFCIKRLSVLHFLKKNVYFRSVDRFTEEICEYANYQMGNASSNKSVYIGSVFVSGSSTRMSVQKSERFYFFKHADATESEVFSLFEWASNAIWRDKAFSPNQPEESHYKRIGLSPFVANNGADYWAESHYSNHTMLYCLSQSDTYKILQRQVGVHPSSLYLGHIDYTNRHDLIGVRLTSLFESDLILNQFTPSYSELSCSDYTITKFIGALAGSVNQKTLKDKVLNPSLSLGRKSALVKKYTECKKTRQRIKKGIIVYLYDFQTTTITEKISSLFAEPYQNRIIPIIPAERDADNSTLMVPPLFLEKIKNAIDIAKKENLEEYGKCEVRVLLFVAAPYSVRISKEIENIILSLGATEVSFLSLFDRRRLMMDSNKGEVSASLGRIDIPSLGNNQSCMICSALRSIKTVQSELINDSLRKRIDKLIEIWTAAKESDNMYGKGIEQRSIILSSQVEEEINRICTLYSQNNIGIWTNTALAMFAIENASITSSPDFISRCLEMNSLTLDEKRNPDYDLSGKMKILLICMYLLLESSSQACDRQIADYLILLLDFVNGQKEPSEYTSLAVLTVSALPTRFLDYLFDQLIEKEKGKEEVSYPNFDALLISLIIIKLGTKTVEHSRTLRPLLCYFKTQKQQLDFIYDAFLYSEKDYRQSHTQALVKIASASELPITTYLTGLNYIDKLTELLSDSYYENLFHDPTAYRENKSRLISKLSAIRNLLSQICENGSSSLKLDAKQQVSDLLEELHQINSQGLYLRAPNNSDSQEQIKNWLNYCRQKAFERVDEKQRFTNIRVSIQIIASQELKTKGRPWFYTFNDVTEEIINIYVDMLRGKTGRIVDHGITENTPSADNSYDGIISLRFKDSYVEISFYNSTRNMKTISEIRKIKKSKKSRSSLLVFRTFDQIFSYLAEEKASESSLNWDYVENYFPGCVRDNYHIFCATVKIPYVDLGSSFAADN